MNAVNHVYKGCQYGLEGCGHVASNVEPLEKVVKITYKVIDFVALVQGAVAAPFKSLSTGLKQTAEVFETIKFFGAMKTLICPENGVYFLTNVNNTVQKRLDRVFLAAHSSLKMLSSLNKYSFIKLGKIAKYSIGHLPVFKFVSDAFVGFSSFFGAWDSIKSLSKVQKNLNNAIVKFDKWEYRETLIALIRGGDQLELADLEKKYADKIVKISQKIALLDQELQHHIECREKLSVNSIDSTMQKMPENERQLNLNKHVDQAKILSNKIAKLQNLKVKYETREFKIARRDYKSLANELREKDVYAKILKWESVKEENEVRQTKCWLKIANSIAKIVVVSLALTLTAINLWTVPTLLTLLGLGIFADSIGLTKIFYEDYHT